MHLCVCIEKLWMAFLCIRFLYLLFYFENKKALHVGKAFMVSKTLRL